MIDYIECVLCMGGLPGVAKVYFIGALLASKSCNFSFSSLFMFPLKIAKKDEEQDFCDSQSPRMSLVPDRRISRAM